jgi:hypothetical protein
MTTPTFDSYEEAKDWMVAEIDDHCIDNYRFAFNDDEAAVRVYEDLKAKGCCGSFDQEVIVAGRAAFIGCNFGH